jgi:hypothetical protein
MAEKGEYQLGRASLREREYWCKARTNQPCPGENRRWWLIGRAEPHIKTDPRSWLETTCFQLKKMSWESGSWTHPV